MDPQDDPEARIRELERPLTGEARRSELAGPQLGGYGAPPAAPPVIGGGAPFPSTPRRSTAGLRGGWIVLAVVAVGAMALAAGIAVFTAHRFSGGGNGSFTTIPSSRPVTTASPTQAPITGPSASTPPLGGKLSVAGIGENQTIACNDSFVDVSGFSNTVVITGHCASLSVSGARNVVTVDAADAIDASGFNNQVTFHSGSPRIDNSGESNVVQQG
ncbi:MAG TPA: DUF3060 domain-containing protein [Mycobacterium sp.]|nr:DUF3060 domain-containing protein [Mycobacterium sp.]